MLRIKWSKTNFLHILKKLVDIDLLFFSFRALSDFFCNFFHFNILVLNTRIYLV